MLDALYALSLISFSVLIVVIPLYLFIEPIVVSIIESRREE